jgi:hypothetical protein
MTYYTQKAGFYSPSSFGAAAYGASPTGSSPDGAAAPVAALAFDFNPANMPCILLPS